MNIESNLSGHWTDEQLIEHLYGIGPEAEHLEGCGYCRERLSSIVETRRGIEAAMPDQAPFDLLAAQRRAVYARIEREQRWTLSTRIRGWAAAGAMIVLLGGGTFLYQQKREHQAAVQSRVSDAQLAQEVSQLAADGESPSTAPLQGLFDE